MFPTMNWISACLVTACVAATAWGCGYPGSPAHSEISLSTESIGPGTVASYRCEPGFELLGPTRRICSQNMTWIPAGMPFCVLNVAAGKAPMQSSVAEGGLPDKAVDGSTTNVFDPETCSLTKNERAPWWYVNLLEPYMVQLVRLDFGQPCCGEDRPATIVVRVGNSRPDLGANPVCNRFTGYIEEGRPLFLPCNPPMPGAFVSVHLENNPGNSLSICETFVYTDQAMPIERCPQFRDQPPGSTSTYNGKCYIFYNQQSATFREAKQTCESRGGSLIDETNPALQGFVSWELWRRHRGDPTGQYWMGAVRDPQDRNNWKWINGRDVSVSFWNLPGGDEDCARYDGTKGWLWSDTNCNLRLHYICQHQPKSCGRPEQPANSTVVGNNFNIGSRVEYKCNPGHLVVGPSTRTCMANGFYNEFPPVCKHLQCGLPARIPNGGYKLVNNSRDYLSVVSYGCSEGFQLVGRSDLICDVDERWNGPPPRCEPVFCMEPPNIPNGGFKLSTNSTIAGTIVEYYCSSNGFELSGPTRIICQTDGHYDKDPPVCVETPENDNIDALLDVKDQDDNDSSPDEETLDESESSVRPTKWTPYNTSPAPPNPSIVLHHSHDDPSDISFTNKPYVPPPARFSTRRPAFSSSTELPTSTSVPEASDESSVPVTDFRPLMPGRIPVTIRNRPTMSSHLPTSSPPMSLPTTSISPETTVRTSSTTSSSIAMTSSLPAVKHDNDTTYTDGHDSFLPQDNEIPDTANVQNSPGPNANEPKNRVEPESALEAATAKLNLGGIIALGVFGGFVFLAAIVTTFVIILRRMRTRKRYQRRGGSGDGHTVATMDSSGADARGKLNKYYQRAWENLQEPGQAHKAKGLRDPERGTSNTHAVATRKETLDDPHYRTRGLGALNEGMRDDGEMVVTDVYPKSAEKKRHHHHHHHHKPGKRNGGGNRNGSDDW